MDDRLGVSSVAGEKGTGTTNEILEMGDFHGMMCAWWSKEMGQGCSCETLQNLSMATGSSHLNAPFLSYLILKALTKSSAL